MILGKKIRKVFLEKVNQRLSSGFQLEGEVQIDESAFGQKVKYHRGEKKGTSVWIFGLVEKKSNTLLLFPVPDRTVNTLLPIIKKFVKPKTIIFSDGWPSYFDLNKHGFRHFSVLHKYNYRQEYENITTGEKISVNTNRIEGAWGIAKQHFKRIRGTSSDNFESHLCQILWFNWNRQSDNILYSYWEDLKSLFPLTTKAKFTFKVPVFKKFVEDLSPEVSPQNSSDLPSSSSPAVSVSPTQPTICNSDPSSSSPALSVSPTQPPICDSEFVDVRHPPLLRILTQHSPQNSNPPPPFVWRVIEVVI